MRAATILFTDNFPDSDNLNAGPTIGNFTVTAGCVDGIQAGRFGLSLPSVDLDGTCYELGTITSTSAIHFSPGSTYTLAFEYSSNNNTTTAVNTAQVTLGTLVDTTITGIANTPQAFSDTFSVGSPTNLSLSFQELGVSDNEGVVVSDISIVENAASTAVPEPGATGFGLVCMGAFILCTRRWRKRRIAKDL
jgi:hypothetical protein